MTSPEYKILMNAARPATEAVKTIIAVVHVHEASGQVVEVYDSFRSDFGRPDLP